LWDGLPTTSHLARGRTLVNCWVCHVPAITVAPANPS
jgi:hypothetical protein